MEPFARLMFYVSVLLLLCVGNFWLKGIAVFLFIVRWLMQVLVINKAACVLGLRRYGLNVVAFDVILPLLNLYMLFKADKYGRRW